MFKKLILLLSLSLITSNCFAGASRLFDGTNDYIAVSADRIDTSNTGTVAFWFNIPAFVNGDCFFGYGDSDTAGGAAGSIFKIELRNHATCGSSARVGFIYQPNDDGTGVDAFTGVSTISTNTWYFYTLSSSGSTWKIYVNGVSETPCFWQGTNTGQWWDDLIPNGTDGTDIGAVFFEGTRTAFMNANIAYVQVYNRQLTDDEVKQIMHYPGSVNGLVGYWPVWGVTSPEPDLSGLGNTGTVTEAAESTNGPPIFLSGGSK